MKNKYKITQSLLSSFNYYLNCEDEQSESAYKGFYKALCREKSPRTEAMQKGIDFEDRINTIVRGEVLSEDIIKKINQKELRGIQDVANIVEQGISQVYAERTLCIDKYNVRLYGYLDYLKAGVIYDIKRTTKYNYGKYFKSPQHPCYFALIEDANEFKYLVFDGNLHIETYFRNELPNTAEDLIFEFFQFLKNNDLWETYTKHWSD